MLDVCDAIDLLDILKLQALRTHLASAVADKCNDNTHATGYVAGIT